MKRLPVDERGFPVPWFVAKVDGKWDFRVSDAQKRVLAVDERRCWVCGQFLGVYQAFLIGPMCGINRVTAEPPAHRECAIFSATACPFMTKPLVERRMEGLPPRVVDGFMIERNPGVGLVWITKHYEVFRDFKGGWLISIGDLEELMFFSKGRAATFEEVVASIDSGFPLLRGIAEKEPTRAKEAIADIETKRATFMNIVARHFGKCG
jgi:hypothetical protein